jgi:hypothetical protein
MGYPERKFGPSSQDHPTAGASLGYSMSLNGYELEIPSKIKAGI